jgi:hypothetical protein
MADTPNDDAVLAGMEEDLGEDFLVDALMEELHDRLAADGIVPEPLDEDEQP